MGELFSITFARGPKMLDSHPMEMCNGTRRVGVSTLIFLV